MKTISFFLLFAIAIGGCKTKPDKDQKHTNIKPIFLRDSFITNPCAMIIYPSNHIIDSMKQKDGEDFYTIADDNGYYVGQSLSYLDSVKVKKIVKQSKGVALFKTKQGKVFRLDLDSLYWSVLLFNGTSKPLKADILNIGEDYKKYMKQ